MEKQPHENGGACLASRLPPVEEGEVAQDLVHTGLGPSQLLRKQPHPKPTPPTTEQSTEQAGPTTHTLLQAAWAGRLPSPGPSLVLVGERPGLVPS